MIQMQAIPDVEPISGGADELQNAGRAYLDQNPKAMAVWRAHQWMWSAAAPEQLEAAILKALAEVGAAEHEMPAALEKHNIERLAVGMPPASLDEFRFLVTHMVIHVELLNTIAAGARQ
jgi:hypothetical protein